MADFVCPFCKSDKLLVEQPQMIRTKDWPPKYKHATAFCCRSQARNQEYIDKRYDSRFGRIPTLEEVAHEK